MSVVLGRFAGRIAADLASRPGKYKNDTRYIVLRKWYWITQLLFSLFFGFILAIPFIDPEIILNQIEFILYLVFFIVYVISMLFLFLHFTLYKIIIENDHMKLRKLFKYKKYEYENIYINISTSYDFLYYNGRYLTRLAYQLNNIGTLYETYLKYFDISNKDIPQSENDKIRQPKMWFILIAVIQILILFILFIAFLGTHKIYWMIFLSDIPLLFFLQYSLVWKITFNKTMLTYRNFFGILKSYNIKNVKYKMVNGGYRLLNNGKKICFLWEIQYDTSLFSLLKDIDAKPYNKGKKKRKKNKK